MDDTIGQDGPADPPVDTVIPPAHDEHVNALAATTTTTTTTASSRSGHYYPPDNNDSPAVVDDTGGPATHPTNLGDGPHPAPETTTTTDLLSAMWVDGDNIYDNDDGGVEDSTVEERLERNSWPTGGASFVPNPSSLEDLTQELGKDGDGEKIHGSKQRDHEAMEDSIDHSGEQLPIVDSAVEETEQKDVGTIREAAQEEVLLSTATTVGRSMLPESLDKMGATADSTKELASHESRNNHNTLELTNEVNTYIHTATEGALDVTYDAATLKVPGQNMNQETSAAIETTATVDTTAITKNTEKAKDLASENQCTTNNTSDDKLSSSADNSTTTESSVNNEQGTQEMSISTNAASSITQEDVSVVAAKTPSINLDDSRPIKIEVANDDEDATRGAPPSTESHNAPTIAETLPMDPTKTTDATTTDSTAVHNEDAEAAVSKHAMGEVPNRSALHANETSPVEAESTTEGNNMHIVNNKEAVGTSDRELAPASPAAVDKSETDATHAMPIDASDRGLTMEVEENSQAMTPDTSLPAAAQDESTQPADPVDTAKPSSPSENATAAKEHKTSANELPASTATATTASILPRGPWARATIFTKTAVAIGKQLLEEVNSVCGLTATVSTGNDTNKATTSGGSSAVGESGSHTDTRRDRASKDTDAMEVDHDTNAAVRGEGGDAVEGGPTEDFSTNVQKEAADEGDGAILCPLCGTKNMTSHLDTCPIMSPFLVLKRVSPSPSRNSSVGDKQDKRRRDDSFGLQLKTKVISKRRRRRLYG